MVLRESLAVTGPSEAIVVDARGHRCPVPTLRLRRALQKASPGAVVELLSDDPMARIDAPHFIAGAGHRLLEVSEAAGVISVKVEKGAESGERGAS